MTETDILNVTVAEVDVINNTETDFLNYTVPGNTLGTNKALRISVRGDALNNSGGTATIRTKITYGATLIYNDLGGSAATDASRRAYNIDLILFAKNATNSQGCYGTVFLGAAGLATTGVGDMGDNELVTGAPIATLNATEDSTANKTFKITVTNSVNASTQSTRRLYSIIELISL